MARHVALFLILLIITPHLALAGGGGRGKKHHGGGKKYPGGRVKIRSVHAHAHAHGKPVVPKKPATPYRPQPRPVVQQPKPVIAPKKPAAPYRPPVHTHSLQGGHLPPSISVPQSITPQPVNIPQGGPAVVGGPPFKGNGDSIIYKGGPLLTGEVNLNLVWYGQWAPPHKDLIVRFLNSFSTPDVSRWWKIVESYQGVAKRGNSGIRVKVGNQLHDDSAPHGKVIVLDFVQKIVNGAKSATPNNVVIILAHSDVAVAELCRGKCYDHGQIDNTPFLIVGNPTVECPWSCGIPFVKPRYGPAMEPLRPPNGDPGIDATISNLAAGLASVVTNPFDNGFSKPGPKYWPIEAGNACESIFGSGACPGNWGKMTHEPAGSFNAIGDRGLKLMLPGVWDPIACTCWTPM